MVGALLPTARQNVADGQEMAVSWLYGAGLTAVLTAQRPGWPVSTSGLSPWPDQ